MKEYRLYEAQIGDSDLEITFEDIKQVVGCTGKACYLNFNGVVIKITSDMAYKDFLELYETRLSKDSIVSRYVAGEIVSRKDIANKLVEKLLS